jgi:hypothetical protein
MIRILFTIVAVVAAMLALIIQQPLLFVAAGLSLVVSLGSMIVRLQRRRSSYKQTASRHTMRGVETPGDLESLGILDIRPRQTGEAVPASGNDAPELDLDPVYGNGAWEDDPPEPSAETGLHMQPDTRRDVRRDAQQDTARANGAGERPPVQSTITIKERAQLIRASVDDSAPPAVRDILVPYLQAFRAAVNANTVCLLKQPDESPHYHIEAIVSLNAYARSSGTFSSKRPLLEHHDARSAPEVTRASDGHLSSHALGYYRERIAVKEFAAAAVPRPSVAARYVLLADAMQERTLDSDRNLLLISYFARLLGAILDTGADDDVVETHEYVRPRREIIGEEIERAHRGHVPLALALVYLNEAERIAGRGETDVTRAERILAGRLRKSAPDARVERFGELTFGVLFKAAGPEVEAWAVDVQRDLIGATGLLEGGVSIGIALLQDRHADADSFRRDATDALREAFESGTCTIVE